MIDRELLKWAAKAAGYRYDMLSDGKSVSWNPLTDDGDALRLAVKCELVLFTPDRDDQTAVARHWESARNFMEEVTNDPCAATRRAIVRAAAEIGKAML